MSSSVPDRKSRHVTGQIPVMSETKYDIATSAQIAMVLGLAAFVGILVAIWLSNLLPDHQAIPMIMETGDGGWEDGSPDETLNVESPEDPSDDPSLSNDQSESQLEQITEQIVSLSDSAATLSAPNEFSDPTGGGNPGSASGTGGRPLGTGGRGSGGTKREQRWIIQFAEQGNLKSYAEQLDFFNIELGCAFKDGRIYYLKNMSRTPVLREERMSDDDKRLYMAWQGGDRVKADLELLVKAGVRDAASGLPLHFYDPATEQMLVRLELDYGGKKSEEIRRTYFQVRKAGAGYEFAVTSQKLK